MVILCTSGILRLNNSIFFGSKLVHLGNHLRFLVNNLQAPWKRDGFLIGQGQGSDCGHSQEQRLSAWNPEMTCGTFCKVSLYVLRELNYNIRFFSAGKTTLWWVPLIGQIGHPDIINSGREE